MSEVKHTPGPWQMKRINYPRGRDVSFEVLAGKNELVAQTIMREVGEGWRDDIIANDAANVHLIAAAPDLFRELDMQVRNCPVCKGEGMAVDVFDILTNEPPHEKTPCNRCASSRAALAKAEGRTP